jgi:hypothetical protein
LWPIALSLSLTHTIPEKLKTKKKERRVMKYACCLALLLLTTQSALAQNEQEAGLCRVETKYDRAADTTTIGCNLFESYENRLRLIVRINVSFQGKEANETAKFSLAFSAYKGDATRKTAPLFKDAATLALSAAPAHLELPISDYRQDFFEMTRLLAEQARAELGREDLRRLLAAQSLAGKWGGAEFRLSGAALAALKELISRQVFTTDGR